MHASVPVVVFQGNLLVSHHSIHRCSNNLQVRCHRYSNNLQVRCNNHSRGLSTHTDLALKTVPGLNPFPVEAVYTQGWSHLIYQSSVHLSLFVNVYPRLTVNALGEPADHFPLPAALRFPTESGWTAGAYCCDCSSGHGVGQVCGGRQTPTSGSLIPERDSPERRAAHLFWRHAAISGPASQASCVVAAVRIAPGTAPITARTERRDPQVQPSSPVQAAQTAPHLSNPCAKRSSEATTLQFQWLLFRIACAAHHQHTTVLPVNPCATFSSLREVLREGGTRKLFLVFDFLDLDLHALMSTTHFARYSAQLIKVSPGCCSFSPSSCCLTGVATTDVAEKRGSVGRAPVQLRHWPPINESHWVLILPGW